ncbi:histidine kinase [Sphingomonas sp. Root50]|uniref:histidine kinase n=1 Tax=Sphingomonas sp. Root50 TaxID=1736551 RepID=UPI001F38070E|nr:histidine kinase [Sphingomonas sp. Root50]
MNHDGPRGASVSPRVALLSIVCFWMVYFAIATIRSYMIDFGHQTEMLAARAFVTIGSMVATYIVYLAMRPLAGKSLAVNVTAVALLAAPAAVAYSSMNWMAFHQLDKQIEAEKARDTASRKFTVDDRSVAAARAQARAAIAAARDAIREATEQAKAAAEAKAEAQREAAQQAAEAQREIEQAQREANENARDVSRDAAREAEQARREALREAEQARREAYQSQREAYREAMADYQEGLREAKQAVEEARRHGININIDSILSSVPPPPVPPAPPAPTPAPAVPAAMPKPATAPVPVVRRPPVKIAIPEPIEIPTPVISEPTPGTVMIQVGPPTDPYNKKKEVGVISQIADQALNGYFFFAAWGALFLALSYAAAVRSAERAAAGYRAAARDAELRALRYQVNPHFLFNTLNSLSTLILKNHRDEAEKMILNLSTFFRTSLTADPTEDVVLAEEIRLQRLYLDIEAIRFPDRLIIDIKVPAELADARVPCLILQPLVENAIKYGVSRARRPVTIEITARQDSEGLVLNVEDDGEPLGDDQQLRGTGVGLKNVADRLKARFGNEASCRYGPLPNGGFGVTIFMPLVRNGA